MKAQDFTPEERSSYIGASESWVVLNMKPEWKTPVQLALEKLGRAPQIEENRFMKAGKMMEDVIADWYTDETGKKLRRDAKTYRLKEYPFIAVHIDRRIVGERRQLECKNADARTYSKWGASGTQLIPDIYFIQVQHQLLFPYWDIADVAALIGGNDFRIYPDIEPDKELQDMIIEAEVAFWNTIKNGYLPKPSNMEDARLLHPKAEKSIMVADDEILELEFELNKNITIKKDAEQKIEAIKASIADRMGENSVLAHNNKKLHSWNEVNTRFNESKFKIDHPDLYAELVSDAFDLEKLKKYDMELYTSYVGKTRRFM